MSFFTDPYVIGFLVSLAAAAVVSAWLIRWTCLDLAAEDDRERQRLNPPGGITPPRHRR